MKTKAQKIEKFCRAQVGIHLCGNKEYKDEYCKKHYQEFNNWHKVHPLDK